MLYFLKKLKIYHHINLLIVPSYKKRRDTFKRTKTTGKIQQNSKTNPERKTGRTQFSSVARQDTASSLTSTYLGQQLTLSQNEGMDIRLKDFKCI